MGHADGLTTPCLSILAAGVAEARFGKFADTPPAPAIEEIVAEGIQSSQPPRLRITPSGLALSAGSAGKAAKLASTAPAHQT